MTNESKRFSVLGVLVAAFAAHPALAQPAEPPGKAKAAENAEDRAAKAEAKAEEKAAKAEARAEDKAKKADEKSDAKGEPGRGPGHDHGAGHGMDPRPGHGADGRRGHAFRRLGDDFRQGKVTKAELKERIAALRASKAERQKENRLELKKRWGGTLAHPACRQELRHHARREAFLSRALFLVQTDVTIKDKEKLMERIHKLIEKENERHARAMERLKSSPASAGSGASAPSPAPSAAAPATSKAGAQ